MKKHYRLLCAVLVAAVLLAGMIPAAAANTAGSWADNSQTVAANTDGSYTVDTAAELAWLLSANLANPTVYITADINLSAYDWPGIASFNGTIIGKNGGVDDVAVTISGMTAPSGLTNEWGFIRSSSGLTVKNLKFTDASASCTRYAMSIVCAKLTGGTATFENLTVSNCTLAQTTDTATLGIGCVIGNNSAAATINVSDVTVINCRLATNTHGVGGVIGQLDGASTAKIVDSSVTALTIITESSKTQIGGLVGRITGGSGGTLTCLSCTLYGNTLSAQANVGGVLGYACNLSVLALLDCTVESQTLSVTSTDAPQVGGLVGYLDANLPNIVLLNCMNFTENGEFGAIHEVAKNNIYVGGCNFTSYTENKNLQIRVPTYTVSPKLLSGASIRTVTGTNGLRFSSTVDVDGMKALAELGVIKSNYSFGTLICQADKLTDGMAFTKAKLLEKGITLYVDIPAKNGIYTNEDGEITRFNAVLSGIGTENKAVEYAARSYADVTLADGTEMRLYSCFNAAENVRSMQYVADRALNDLKSNQTTDAGGWDYCYEVSAGLYSRYSDAQREVLEKWASDAYSADGILSVMTFNIYYTDVTPERVDRVVQTVANAMPSTLGVQECTSKWLSYLKDRLDDYGYACVSGKGQDGGDSGEYNAVFYRTDLFSVVASDTLWLSATPKTPGTKVEASSLNRIMTYVVLERTDGSKMMHVNTHFDHVGGQGEQANILTEQVKTLLGTYGVMPVFVTGDFNSNVGWAGHVNMSKSFIEANSAASVLETPGHTLIENPAYTIDFCFVQNVTADQIQLCRVITDLINGEDPSDHYPVYFEFDLSA